MNKGNIRKDLKEKLKQEGSEFTLEEHMVKVSASQTLTVQTVKVDLVEALESNLQKRFPNESMNVVPDCCINFSTVVVTCSSLLLLLWTFRYYYLK